MAIENQIGAIARQFVVVTASLREVVPAFSCNAIAIEIAQRLSVLLCMLDGCL